MKAQRYCLLVLHNTSQGPTVDFQFLDLPENAVFCAHPEEAAFGTIPSGQEARFPLLLAMGSPGAVDCVVTWIDASRGARETKATVRT